MNDEEEDLPQAGPLQPGEVDLETLDTCTFGRHRSTFHLSYAYEALLVPKQPKGLMQDIRYVPVAFPAVMPSLKPT